MKNMYTKTFWSRTTMVVIMLTVGLGTALAQSFWPDYDFKAINADGDTLYYRITSSSAPYTVAVTRCHDSITYEQQYSFDDYDSSIVIPETVSQNGILYSVTSVDKMAFYGQRSMRTVVLPMFLERIHDDAFAFSTIENVTIPQSTLSLGHYAFAHTLLKSIVIPENIDTLHTGVFVGCDSLRKITFHEGLKVIEENVFSQNLIDSLCFPASLRMLNPLIAEGDLSCKYISFVTDTVHLDDTLLLAVSCFRGLGNSLRQLILSDNIFQLYNNCFQNFLGLDSIVLPMKLKVIPKKCFFNCSNVKMTLPPELDSIASQAFHGCFGTPVINIPASVKYIGYRAFSSFPHLFFYFNMEGEQPPILEEEAFYSHRTMFFTTPCGSLPSYESAPVWSELLTQQNVIVYESCDGIDEYEKPTVKVYPVPVENTLHVECDENTLISIVEIYDLLGHVIISKRPDFNNTVLDLSLLPSGTFLLVLKNYDGSRYCKTIVKK